MELKFSVSLIFVYLYGITLALSLKYEHISDCDVKRQTTSQTTDDIITFICGDKDNEHKIFNSSTGLTCSTKLEVSTLHDEKGEYEYGRTIMFQNCSFPTMKRNYFKMFPSLQLFMMPNAELEKMETDIFQSAKKLLTLDVSHNKLTEIPSRIFINATDLEYADFSYNSIKHIGLMAFDGATNLRSLILSNNQIELDSLTFNLPNLLSLDLSFNSLVQLPENVFDKLVNLEELDLSFNALGALDVNVFSYLFELKDLNLQGNNLTNINFGTFSHQHKFVWLDLSGNKLQELDFQLFYPIQHDLYSLRLENNQLKHLNGFQNSLFPKLNTLSIQGNKFDCVALAHFMKTINWGTIRLYSYVHLIDVKKPNIRGINCEGFEEAALDYDTP